MGLLGVGSASVAADDSKGDALPNGNVPDADIYAFPDEPDPIEVESGNWITFSNGWISSAGLVDECTLQTTLDNTTQRFVIDGEEFVLDSLDDWDFEPDADGEDQQGNEVLCRASFSHSVPPKPPGTTFEVRWDLEIDDEDAVEGDYPFFPLENNVTVVSRGGR